MPTKFPMDEPVIFQARKRYRIQYVSAWIAGLILFTFFGASMLVKEYGWLTKVIFLLIIAAPIFLGVYFSWMPPGKLKIILDTKNISGSIGNQDIQFPFDQILHIENVGHTLQIDATNGHILLKKQHFDLETVEAALKKRLSPDVFTDKGWLNLPVYQEVLEQQEALYSELLTKLPLRINQELTITYKIFAAISTVLFSAATFFSWHQLGYGSLLFLLFAVLGVLLLLRQGVLEVDSRQISYETRFRKFRILWENVTHVEYDDMLILAFQGQKQCLKIPSTLELKGGKEKELFYFFLDQMVKQKNIEQRRSSRAFFRFNKNTRVPK